MGLGKTGRRFSYLSNLETLCHCASASQARGCLYYRTAAADLDDFFLVATWLTQGMLAHGLVA